MQFTQISIVALAALLQAVQADFDLYRIGISAGGLGGNGDGWQVYPDSWTCDDAIDWIWRDSNDVSGSKYGVRCKGDGCGRVDDADPADIDTVEMNFNSDEYHWTYYKDRDGALVDLDGNNVGSCEPLSEEPFVCGLSVGQIAGMRKLRCTLNVSNEEINDNQPSKKLRMRHVRM